MTLLVAERNEAKEMNAGISHPLYRVTPAGFARGFFVGICKMCPNDARYQTARNGSSHDCEKALHNHLRDGHGIEDGDL